MTPSERVEAGAEAMRAYILAVDASRTAALRLYAAEHDENGEYYYLADTYDGPRELAPEQCRQVWERSKAYGKALEVERQARQALEPYLRGSF